MAHFYLKSTIVDIFYQLLLINYYVCIVQKKIVMEKTEITKTEILEEGSFYTLFNKGIATYLESFAFVVIIMFSLTIFQVIRNIHFVQ